MSSVDADPTTEEAAAAPEAEAEPTDELRSEPAGVIDPCAVLGEYLDLRGHLLPGKELPPSVHLWVLEQLGVERPTQPQA